MDKFAEADIVELLKLAKADSSASSALRVHLKNARASFQLFKNNRKRPPPEVLDQLNTSIKRTLSLLQKLEEEYPANWRDISFLLLPVGTGIVDVKTVQEMITGGTLTLPRRPTPLGAVAADALAAVNVRELLSIIRNEVQRARPKKQGRLQKRDKLSVVHYATSFFCKHSTLKATTYFDGRFVRFCERFYEVATRVKGEGLETQIRAILLEGGRVPFAGREQDSEPSGAGN